MSKNWKIKSLKNSIRELEMQHDQSSKTLVKILQLKMTIV